MMLIMPQVPALQTCPIGHSELEVHRRTGGSFGSQTLATQISPCSQSRSSRQSTKQREPTQLAFSGQSLLRRHSSRASLLQLESAKAITSAIESLIHR